LGPVFSPPEPGPAQPPVGRLPLPLDLAQLVALLDQESPDLLEDAVSAPPLEPAVHRTVVAILLGQSVPLAAAAEAEDDAVEGRAPIDPIPAAVLLGRRWGVLQQDRLDPFPQFVGDLPDRLQGLDLTLGPCHGCVS
jgi:hypothetical protein